MPFNFNPTVELFPFMSFPGLHSKGKNENKEEKNCKSNWNEFMENN